MASGYRPDIDGLRAVAIVPVVLYHAGVPLFAGGFVGVDVFFVISGFLITRLVADEVAAGSFSFERFYERRIRRLLPAAIPVVIFCLAIAMLAFDPARLVAFLNSLAAFVAIGANWFFLAETGYFAEPASGELLLHTWSLAIEEQFYLLFPLLLVVLARRPAVRIVAVALAFLASLAFASILLRTGASDSAFFNSFARFWEILAGAILALLPRIDVGETARAALRGIGLGLIAIAVLTHSRSMPFPGPAALLPVAGVALAIVAGPAPRDPSHRLLSLRPVTYLGRISYSLYLWHWPLLVAAPVVWPSGGAMATAAAVLLSLALAILSYRLVEQPFRTRRVAPRRRHAYATLGLVLVLVAPLVVVGNRTDGAFWRFDDYNTRLLARLADAQESYRSSLERSRCFISNTFRSVETVAATFPADCIPPPDGRARALVFGDSRAAHLMPGLVARYPGVQFAQVTAGRCPPVFEQEWLVEAGQVAGGCQFAIALVRDQLSAWDIDMVILSASWRGSDGRFADRALWNTVDEIAASGVEVVMIGQSADFRRSMSEMAAAFAETGEVGDAAFEAFAQRFVRLDDASARDRELAAGAAARGIRYLPILPLLCPDTACRVWTPDGQAILTDGGHYSIAGSNYVVGELQQLFP